MEEHVNANITTIAIAIIAFAALAGAIFLQWDGQDSTAAWAGFTGALGMLAGQQMRTPGI
jgi:hypothetical protein